MKKIALSLLILLCVSCQTQIDVHMVANKRMNPEANKRNFQPVSILVYQLKDDKKFRQAEFFQLIDEPGKALGADYLGPPSNFMISPNEKKDVSFKLNSDAKYFGVVAAFQVIDKAKWRAVLPVKKHFGTDFSVEIKNQTLYVHE